MTNTQQQQALLDSLSCLEACLETPIIPGELAAWVGEVSKAIAEVGVHLRHQIKVQHEEMFAQIVSQDAELLQRVENMKDEDRALIKLHEQLLERTATLCDQVGEKDPPVAVEEEDASAIIEEGLSLVIRVRKQEKALTTWFIEAFNRDRGVAD